MLIVALLTALISVNGSVAALLPVVVVTAIRVGLPTSQLLMPLVFAAHAGSMLALTGTPVNVLVSDAAEDAGLAPFGYFEFAKIGIPLLLGSMAIILLIGRRLLPERSGRALPRDLSSHARTLVEQYRLHDGLFRLRVRAGSPYVGAPRGRGRPEGVPRPDPGRHRGRRPRRTRRAAHDHRGRRPRRARGRRNRRAAPWRQGPRLPVGGHGRRCRGHPLQPRIRSGGGRHPAPVGAGGGGGVPGDGHRERRSHRPGRASAWRGPGSERDGARRRRHAAAPGDLEGARRAPRRPRRPRRRLAGSGPSSGRPHGRGSEAGHRRAARHGRPARHRRDAGGRRGAARGLRHGPALESSRSTRPTTPSTGRRSSWSAP